MRIFLKKGTLIRVPGGIVYKIIGAPIGEGGGSILYPAQRYLPGKEGEYNKSPILYALKECYPLSSRYTFSRNAAGEIVPAKDQEGAAQYLARAKEMQAAENAATGEIYHRGFRLTPILEAYREVGLSFDEGRTYQKVENSITVMEALSEKGVSLKNCLKERKHLPVQETFRIVEQVLYAVREVHEAGYLHLDLQAGNIFLKGTLADGSGMISLIDFGSARKRLEDGLCGTIEDGVLYATPGFSAPEMLSGNDGTLKLGPEADIYSIGYLMLLLLTGHKFLPGEMGQNKERRYIPRFAIRKTRCPKHMVERMQSILAKALESDPENRYADTEEMLKDIRAFLEMLAPYKDPLSGAGYDAFICYRHGSVDTAAAKALRDGLERYKDIKRVFLDEGELSSCADFGERIREALENSQWLIVICSGKTKESVWVNDEIRTFLQYHDPSHILAVITEGEPEEILPDALLQHGMDADRLLAADARAKDKRRIIKKVRGDVKLKVAAPMLHTTFDTLKQRRRVYEIKRAFAVMSAVFVAFSAFLGYAAVKSREIAEQALTIADEHKTALESQAMYMVGLAEQSLEEHDHIGAIRQALRGYDLAAEGDVFIPGLYQILVNSMGLYVLPLDAQETVTAQGNFQWESPYNSEEYFLDEKGEHLFTAGDSCMYVWDTDTFQCIKKIKAPWTINTFREEFLVESRGQYLLDMDGGYFACYDYEKGTSVWECKLEGGQHRASALSEDKTRLAVLMEEKLYIIDAADGKIRRSSAIPGGPAAATGSVELCISSDNEKIAFSKVYRGEEGEADTYEMILYDVETDQYTVVSSVQNRGGLDFTYVGGCFVDGDKLLVLYQFGANRVFTDTIKKYYSEKVKYEASLYDPDEKCFLWSNDREEMTVGAEKIIKETQYGDSSAILWVHGKTCEYLDLATGKTVDRYVADAPVIQAWCEEDRETFVLQNGYLLHRLKDEQRLRGYAYFSGDLTGCQKCGADYYIKRAASSFFSDERTIMKYREGDHDQRYERCAYMGEDEEVIVEQKFPETGVKHPDKWQSLSEDTQIVSKDERYAARVKGNSIVIEDKAKGGEIFVKLRADAPPESLFWMEKGDKLLIGYADEIFLYDMHMKKLSEAVAIEDADMSNAVWMQLDEATLLYIGATYSYVIDVTPGHLGVLYRLRGVCAYDPKGDDIYFSSQAYSMDRMNEGVYYDAMEVGKIHRYSKDEIIEMARELAG